MQSHITTNLKPIINPIKLLLLTFIAFGLIPVQTSAQTVNSALTLSAGTLSVSSSGTCNFTATVSASSQNVTCNLSNIQIQDLRGSGAGWTATMNIRNFDGSAAGILTLCPTIACASSRFQLTPSAVTTTDSTLGVTDAITGQTTTTLTNLTNIGVSNNFNLISFSNATQTYGRVTVTSGGTGYTSAPTVAFTGGTCTQNPVATATVTSNVVTAVTITTAGIGCTSAPTVGFTGGAGTGAAATAISGAGEGLYTKGATAQLTIPAYTRAGTYTSVITISVS